MYRGYAKYRSSRHTWSREVNHLYPLEFSKQHRVHLFAISSVHCGSISCKMLMYFPNSSTLAWQNLTLLYSLKRSYQIEKTCRLGPDWNLATIRASSAYFAKRDTPQAHPYLLQDVSSLLRDPCICTVEESTSAHAHMLD